MAVIARHKYTLLKGIFDTLSKSPDAKIALTGGLPGFEFSTLEDVYYLKLNLRDKIESAEIKRFGSIAELLKYAESTDDMPLQIMINVR